MAPIPSFPEFRRLAIDDRPAIEALTAPFPPSSDFGFASLWAWDTDESCAVSRLHGNLVVRFKDFTTDAHFYSFVGDRAVVETARALLAYARQEGLAARFQLVPEAVVAADDRLSRLLSVTEDRDNFDYVYSAAEWVRLDERRFHGHRRKIARCRKRSALECRPLALGDPSDQAAMLDLHQQWMEQKPSRPGEERRHELTALGRVFALADDDRLGACGLHADGRLVAFSIWERLPHAATALVHFQKTDRSWFGLSSRQMHETSRCLSADGCLQINLEQDLGLPGLRDYKLSLQPCAFLRKYIIGECPEHGNQLALRQTMIARGERGGCGHAHRA
jgi:hypothetical protein